jgi:hypothetical protein
VHDHYRPLAARSELRDPPHGKPYDPRWLAAIDWALQVRPGARPQGIAEWREALGTRPSRRRRSADRAALAAPAERQHHAPPPAPLADAYARTEQLGPPPRARALPARFALAAAAAGFALLVVQAPPPAEPPVLRATPVLPVGPLQALRGEPPIAQETALAAAPDAAPPADAAAASAASDDSVTPALASAVAPTDTPVQKTASTAPSATAEAAQRPHTQRARPLVQTVASRPFAAVVRGAPEPAEVPVATSAVAEVVVARSTEVRERAVVTRSAAGSVVQVSPAGPNRAAVYVAHPMPVSGRVRGE